ncbi:MAG TPA: ABC transporter substrate-binding protein [Steroidobacteraceae bacterium]|nr:ABC transporter substrate-binding protein [Steroidobacteraceae bacterium]
MTARHAAIRVPALLALALLAGAGNPFMAAAAGGISAPRTFPIVYLSEAYPEPGIMPSLLETHPADEGLAGAREGTAEINTTGKFLGWNFKLYVEILPAGADVAAQTRRLFARGPLIIVADLRSDDLLKLADAQAAKGSLIFDMRTIDDDLRQKDCRSSVFHVLPNQAMRADALAQFLVEKRWTRWFLLQGPTPQDAVYAADVRRSATRYGARVVAARSYDYNPGSRRSDTGYQQIQTQMPLATQIGSDYDVLFVADETDLFGDYLPYNTFAARPVVGTQGLIAAAWTPAFQSYSALQMQHRFELFAHRPMTERDYGGWLAVSIVGDAVMRGRTVSPAGIRAYLRSDNFLIAGFKGQGLTFRSWDQQLRQPVLIAQPLMVISLSPQSGFLHPGNTTDTLGFDQPETQCRMAH